MPVNDRVSLTDSSATARGDSRTDSRSDSRAPPDDMTSLFLAVFGKIKFKIVLLLFLVFMYLNTSSFIESVLTRFSGAVDGRVPTEGGIVVQGVILVLAYVVIGLLVDTNTI